MKSRIPLVLILAAVSLPSQIFAQWNSLPLITDASRAAGNSGGEGCQVVETLTCDSTGNLVIATTDVGGLLRSTDGASTWTPINVAYSPRGATAVAIDPKNSRRMIVAGSDGGASQWVNGLYLSTDQGDSWKVVMYNTNAVTKPYRDQLAYDPTSYSSNLGYTQRVLWSSSGSNSALYRSEDGGTTWTGLATTTLSGTATGFGGCILKFDPNGVLYAGHPSGIYKSTDQGMSFSLLVSGTIKGMDVVNASKIYYNNSSEVWVYDVATATSTRLSSSGLPTGSLTYVKVSPVDQSHMSIFAGGNNPICYSLNSGSTWARSSAHNSQSFIPDNSNQNGHAGAWHPTNPNLVYAYGWGMLLKSTDAGANLYWSNNGYTGVMVSGYFNFNVQNPNLLLLTSQDYNSALTINGGYTWKYLNVANTGWGGYNYGGYAMSSGSSGRMFAGNSASWGGTRYLRVSMNGGSTWTDLGLAGNSNDAACGDPADPNVAFWDQWRTGNGVANGTAADWSQMSGCSGVLTYNPATKELIGRSGTSVVLSSDHGVTWAPIASLPESPVDIAIDHTRNRIYATTGSRKLYFIDIGKSSAIDITNRLPVDQTGYRGANSVAVDPTNPDIVYEGEHSDTYMTNVAVARSLDAGQTWTSLTKKPGDSGPDGGHEAQCVRVHPGSRYLYVGGECFGVWSYAPPTNAATVFEAENLSVVDSSNAVPVTGTIAGTSAGAVKDFGTQGIGAYVTLALPNCKATTYKLDYAIRHHGNPGGPGVFQLAYSESPTGPFTNLGQPVNYYDGNFWCQVISPGAITFTTPGTKYLRFTCTGRSGGDTYDGKIDVVSLTDLMSLETESLSVAATSGASHSIVSDTNFYGGLGTTLSGTASGDFVSYSTPSLVSGSYHARIGYKATGSSATFQISVDGNNLSTGIDAYSASDSYRVADLGAVTLSSGTHTVQFSVTGKNAASAGYSISLDYLQLSWTGAPLAPSGLVASATDSKITLAWSPCGGANSYNVKRATISGGPYTTVANCPTAAYTDSGLTNTVTYYYVVSALNPDGESANSSECSARPMALPAITSILAATGTTGVSFSYQITASNSPTSFNATGLPAGMSVNTTTGLISGTPASSGSSSVTLRAYNVSGSGSATLVLNILPVSPPIITSAPSATGTVGNPMTYQITATNTPTSYGATGLPSGLILNPSTGLISGTPSSSGTSNGVVSATNNAGTGSLAVSFAIAAPAPPVITSALSASGTVGTPLTYQITATNFPTSFTASGLPPSLALNSATGLISGTPSATGTTLATIGAVNSSGTGTATVAIIVDSAIPVITSSGSATGMIGIPFSYQITATGNPTSFNATSLPSGLSIDAGTGLVTGVPTGTGTTNATVSATNPAGTGSAILQLTILPQPPAAPTGLTATGSNAVVLLNWNSSPGATSYNVKRSLGSGYTLLSSTTGTNFRDTSVTNSTTYYYVVSAVNAGGESADSTEVSATPMGLLPSPWQLVDIGAVGTSGSASYTSGTFTVAGAGAGISGTSDSLSYLSQPAGSNFTFIARVATVQNTNSGAKAGLIIRNSIAPNAAGVGIWITPSNGANFTSRTTTGGSVTTSTANGKTAPCWVKLIRSGSTLSGYYSTNGTTWKQLGSTQTIALGANASLGFGVSSKVTGTPCTATFDNVSAPPGITSPTTATGTSGVAFLYQITASNSPSSYDAAGLPDGLLLDSSTGIISGSPTTSGTSLVTLSAYNAQGDGSTTLTINILPAPPVITSAPTASGTVGNAFTYQILASNSPLSFGATPLPPGLSLNSSTGLISGTPTIAGTTNLILTASNSGGIDDSPLALTILPSIPAAPSNLTAIATNGIITLSWNVSANANGYRIRRSLVSGTSYSILADTGLSNYTDSGVIGGSRYYYIVSAYNQTGESGASGEASALVPVPISSKELQSSISLSGSGVYLTITNSVAGHIYQLQRSDALTPANWTNIGLPKTGDGTPVILYDPGTISLAPRRFYRIQIQQ